MKKFDRVITLLTLLQTKRTIKASSIADRFGISLRTVYRDILTLKNAGIPIIGDPGIGYSLVDGYRIPPVMFNEGETSALLAAEKFIGKIMDTTTAKHYANALMKIKSILRSSERQALESLDESILLAESSHWSQANFLPDVFKSIATKNLLEIHYVKADGTSSLRKVEPIGCYHQYYEWYLIGYCQLKKDYRTFKMNRISNLQVLQETYQKNHISLQDYVDLQNESWREEQQFQNIEIAFNQSFLSFAEKRKYYFGFVSQSMKGEKVHMYFVNSSLEIVARWLLQFGDQATVIAPPALINRMKTLSSQLYYHYQKK